jgi:meso-butanediol dehydrogenase/(S,S)-butanediol dehydrogenase/diacetyl reductase
MEEEALSDDLVSLIGPGRFRGRTALVTGAASGIGRATALRLAAEGARVFAADRDAPKLEETVAQIRAAGGEAVPHALDVSDAAACRAAVEAAAARLGRLDVLANVAGVMYWGHLTDVSEADWARTLGVNLSGVFFLCQAAVPHLLASKGVIVNVASAAAIKGQAYTAPYCVSKAGVVSLTKCLAVEYAKRGLRAVALCPGGVNTPLNANLRLPDGTDMALFQRLLPLSFPIAEPEEIAAAVAYLASDEARFVNGAVFSIDGGQTAG